MLKKTMIVVSMLVGLSSFAEELPFLDAKVKTLATFKDGTVFVLKEGTVTVGPSGKVLTSPITDAAFGTVGVNSLTEGVHVKMVAASAVSDSGKASNSFSDARNSAHGRPVTILRRGSKEPISGELLSLRSPSGLTQAVGLSPVKHSSDLVMTLKQSNGIISLIPMNEIKEWKFHDSDAPTRDPENTGQHLTISLKGAKAGQTVKIAYYYLWKGVRWTPSYLLERDEAGRVRVELRGEVTNKLIDLQGTKLFLIVGVPNFAYLKTPSPLVAQKTLQQVTTALSNSKIYARNDFSNTQFTQMTSNIRSAPTAKPVEIASPTPAVARHAAAPELPNAQSTDAGSLYLFEVEDIDLAKGERAIIHLATMNLTCKDLVTWNIGDASVNTANHTTTPRDRASNPMIHYWMLKANETPLTTGPGLVMKGEIALSQDTIYYTPRHTAGRFKVGNAVGIIGQVSETVLSRESGSKEVKDKQSHYKGKSFWLMREIRWIDETRELTIKVKNGQKFDTDVQVTRSFYGRPEKSEDVSFQVLGGMGESQDQLNRMSWNISLKPGMEKNIKIRYTARVFIKK